MLGSSFGKFRKSVQQFQTRSRQCLSQSEAGIAILFSRSNLVEDKENLSRWWGEDRENPRDEPLSLDRALARSRREVHPEGFPILTSSTWLIIYLAYFLHKPHFNQMFFGLQSIWHIYRVGKCRLTSPSDVITTCVRTHSRTSNG